MSDDSVFNEIKKVYATGGRPLFKWDEDQPRAENGQFGSGGGGGGSKSGGRQIPNLSSISTKGLNEVASGAKGWKAAEVKQVKAELARREATVHGKEAKRIRASEAQMRSAGMNDIADNYATLAQQLEERSART